MTLDHPADIINSCLGHLGAVEDACHIIRSALSEDIIITRLTRAPGFSDYTVDNMNNKTTSAAVKLNKI